MEVVERLASDIGPRPLGSPSYLKAVELVETRLKGAGYTTRRQRFSIDVDKGSGESFNVIGEPPSFDGSRPFVVIGAHLDTVPGSPGGNDNASGVAVMIELARRMKDTSLQLVFVAFGGEERQGSSDGLHGSSAYVSELTPEQRHLIKSMISIDTVGRGKELRVCSGEPVSDPLVEQFVATARASRIPARAFKPRFRSDNASFEAVEIPAVWLWTGEDGPVHTPGDNEENVNSEALELAFMAVSSYLQSS